jgi:hypothetical protein
MLPMKKSYYLHKILFAISLPVLIASCDDDDSSGSGTDFGTIETVTDEIDASTFTIPLRNANASIANYDVIIGGGAKEGEDIEIVSLTEDGLVVKVIDDAVYEGPEQAIIQLVAPDGSRFGNSVHTMTIYSNCEDQTGFDDTSWFAGDYSALEDYGANGTYGPYDIEFEVDSEDPTILRFDNFYDSGCDAYAKINLEDGTIYFPDQAPCDVELTNSSGTFTYDLCSGETVFTINLNFDGGDWVYHFTR